MVADLQISIRESGDVTILDLQGRATIGAHSDLLSVHLQKLVANGLRVHLHNFKQCDRIDAYEALVFPGSDVVHDAKDVIALRQFCRYLGRSLEIAEIGCNELSGEASRRVPRNTHHHPAACDQGIRSCSSNPFRSSRDDMDTRRGVNVNEDDRPRLAALLSRLRSFSRSYG